MSVNTLVMGSPGSGKSTLLEKLVVPYLLRIKRGENIRLVVTDEHGPFARAVGTWCVRLGLEEKMAYDRFTDKRALAYRFRTLGADALLAKREFESFMNSLMVLVGNDASIGHTFYREAGRLGWGLAKWQKVPYPLLDIRFLLRPGELRDQAISGCTDPDTHYMARSFVHLTRMEQERVYRTVVRALDDLGDGRVFSSRCDGTYDGQEPITIIEGSKDVATEESRMTIQMVSDKAIDSGMVEEGTLVVASDEAISLWNPSYARKLEQGRKYNVKVINGLQFPAGTPELVGRMFNVFDEQWYGFMAGHRAAEEAAKNLLAGADPSLKERQTRRQQFHDGYDEMTVDDRTVLVGRFREEEVHQDRSVPLREQVTDFQRSLMNLKVGEFYRRNGNVTKVKVPQMKAYPLNPDHGERLLDEAIARIQTRPYYVDVHPYGAGKTSVPPCENITTAKGMRKSSRGNGSTRAK